MLWKENSRQSEADVNFILTLPLSQLCDFGQLLAALTLSLFIGFTISHKDVVKMKEFIQSPWHVVCA